MLYETALIWVLISAGYWGIFLLRRGVYQSATFPLMMLGAAALAGLGLLGAGEESQVLSLAGAIGLGAGACLLVIGPLARRFARRANSAERWALARALYEVADALQPGTGVRDEKRLAAAFAEIQAGKVDEAVKALRVVRDRAPAPAQRAFDEHITMIYMTAWQWPEAIAHAEATLLRASPMAASASEEEAALQRALLVRSISAPLWVELIGAYCRVGDLARAASMLEAFEAGVADEPRAAPLLHRARLVFLAMCGRVEAVRELAAPASSPHMTKAARRYWVGVAADRAGDRELAVSELRAAIAASRGRARRMAEVALTAAQAPAADRADAPLSAETSAIADSVAARPLPVWQISPRPWLTWIECGLCVVVAVALSALGPTAEISTLVRGGAMVRGLVDDGQWWRLATSVFVHVGTVHMAVNVVSLWVIGRLAEDVFGRLRAALLFAACGFAGATASYFASQAGISAGASGAIFGLVGATLGELTVHRRHFALAIRNGLWGALAIVAVSTLVIGAQVPQIDQWAHVAGLATGLALGQLVSPRHRTGRFAPFLAWPMLAGFVALLAWGSVEAARSDFASLMLGGPRVTASVGGLQAEVPRRWRLLDGELVDPDVFVVLTAEVVSLAPEGAITEQPVVASEAITAWFDGEPARARERNFASSVISKRIQLPLPAPWQTRELELTAPDPLSGDQRYRLVSFARVDGTRLVRGSFYAPQSLVDAAAPLLLSVLSSLR